MKYLIVSCLIILFSCNSKSSKKLIKDKKGVDSKLTEKKINPVKRIKRGEKIKLFVIEEHSVTYFLFDTISSKEFKKYFKKDVFNKVKIRKTTKVIDIPTAAQTYQFNHYNPASSQTGDRGYELLNYFPETKIYALNHNFISDDLGFSQLVLIDSVTDYQYELESNGDNALEAPVFSSNNSYFATFRNKIYEDNGSTIAIFKINHKEKPKTYLTLKSVDTFVEFNIESICWKNDKTLLLKCFKVIEEDDEMRKEVIYLKTIIN